MAAKNSNGSYLCFFDIERANLPKKLGSRSLLVKS